MVFADSVASALTNPIESTDFRILKVDPKCCSSFTAVYRTDHTASIASLTILRMVPRSRQRRGKNWVRKKEKAERFEDIGPR